MRDIDDILSSTAEHFGDPLQARGWRHADDMVDPKSFIETLMLKIVGTATDRRARFVKVDTILQAEAFLASGSAETFRHEIVVFPQVAVERYRADFLVTVVRRGCSFRSGSLRHIGFFIECDGRDFHGASEYQRDKAREAELLRLTGIPTLRFSGAEITHASHLVGEILSAQIEFLLAEQAGVVQPDSPARKALQAAISRLTEHPIRRGTFMSRNSAWLPDSEREEDWGRDEMDPPLDQLRRAGMDLEAEGVASRQEAFEARIARDLAHQGWAEYSDPVTCRVHRLSSTSYVDPVTSRAYAYGEPDGQDVRRSYNAARR